MLFNEPGRKERFLIGIAGGSGSGKTTFAGRIISECRKAGINGQVFSLDNYYKPLSHLSLRKRKLYNFDHPNAIDSALAHQHIKKLLRGESVQQPVYDFKLHTRKKKSVTRHPARLIIVEGLYALHFPEFLPLYDYKIFVSTGIATAILRRVQRDIEERGRTIEEARRQILATVLPMYETYVKPTQKNAHFSINWEGVEIPEKATEGFVRMLRDHLR